MSNQQESPLVLFERDIFQHRDKYLQVLPPSIRPEEFMRVAVTAVQNRPELLNCTKQSLMAAFMKAAEDGLLPDGREGAVNVYKTKVIKDGRDVWFPVAQWLPMVEGVVKRLGEAGILMRARVVYAGDDYDYQEGDQPRIIHRPKPGTSRTDAIVAVYSIAVFPDGRLHRDWMWIEQVEQIRGKYSKSKGGPWADPVAYPEMALKTVIHHHSKSLPVSAEIKRIVHRDDFLYDLGGQERPAIEGSTNPALPAETAKQAIGYQPGRTVETVLDGFAREPATVERHQTQAPLQPAQKLRYDPETGVVIEDDDGESQEAAQAREAARPAATDAPDPEVMAILRLLNDSPQPANAGEYEGWLLVKAEGMTTPAGHEAIRQYWKLTGGTRKQFGMTKEAQESLRDRLMALQPQPA